MNLLIVQKWFHPDLEAPAAPTGAISGVAAMSFGEGSSTITGAGALAGASAMIFGAGSSTLVGTGALAGASAMLFGAGSSTLVGTGALAGASAMIFGAGSSTLLGSGALAGAAAIVFDATGAMVGPGAIEGVAAMTFAGTAVLDGSGALVGVTAMLFGSNAALSGGAPAQQAFTVLIPGTDPGAAPRVGELSQLSDRDFQALAYLSTLDPYLDDVEQFISQVEEDGNEYDDLTPDDFYDSDLSGKVKWRKPRRQ